MEGIIVTLNERDKNGTKNNRKNYPKITIDDEIFAEKIYFWDESIIITTGSDIQRNRIEAVSVVVKCANDRIEVKEEAIIDSREGAWTNDEYHNCMGGGSDAITGKNINVNIVHSNNDANIFEYI